MAKEIVTQPDVEVSALDKPCEGKSARYYGSKHESYTWYICNSETCAKVLLCRDL